MHLQQFVSETIENLGGMVMPLEYALCDVLIPEDYASYFQNKTELRLSFDFEVAQENPDSEFVTFGSYVLEQLLNLIHEKTATTIRYAEVDRLALGNPQQKIETFLHDEQGSLAIESEKPVLGVWAVFQYHTAIIADEKTENTEQVWINMLTNECDSVMKQKQNYIMYQQQSPHTYPVPVKLDMDSAFQHATAHVREINEQQKNAQIDKRQIEKDIERINHYYNALLAENDKRAKRKGLSEAKQQEILAKKDTIKLERDKQLNEIYKKANGEIEINLENAILYFIPLLEYTINHHFRGNEKQITLYYNPISKNFFKYWDKRAGSLSHSI
ncbi:hypothetical protein [Lentibacillus jeotgali]|uniref:hypothetical protein n=1 Tax=Lentibacillus jeotgali TaxID=558169 RepID=UPI0002628077|nr:hypothetical protein [Lentibacillus jeotgali]